MRQVIPVLLVLLVGVLSCKRTRPPVGPVLPSAKASRQGFVDLLALAQLGVLNVYFKEGTVERKLADYIGTQTAHVEIEPRRGLKLLSEESLLPALPLGQARAFELIAPSMRGFRNYRYYYAVVFAKSGHGSVGSAVLLGANSLVEMDRLGDQLIADADTVCYAGAKNCTVFPQTCTVTLQMGLIVNGKAEVLQWGANLANVAPADKAVRLSRGRVVTESPVGDPKRRGVVLLPGDRVDW